ncbi:Scr1 family TA system antitoxin-like transcriptional regulator [Streptomyces niveus]|uniref:Scr1 family TA system antitoxin-like transcriptional regulator n=1 Tax=Streptomyces niveus TaxID=193462 RepID=UPI0038382EAF
MSVQNPQQPGTWRYCGNQLLRWRTQSGMSREELAAATIKAMEQGVRMPTPRLLEQADDLLQANGKLSAAKDYLKREKFPPRAQDFMDREVEAISLWSYEVALIPGLLQTEAYARALIGNHSPPLDDETVEERVTARLERQSLLTRKPLAALNFVLYEAALRGPHVDKEQLLHMLEHEVAACPSTVHVRDSKLTDSPELALPVPAWSAFVQYAATRRS